MYVPYKNMKNQPDNPQAIDKVDAYDVQADVLATDVSENSKIPSLKQLKTETKIPTKAINALNEQLGNAQASASDAVQRTVALEETVDHVAQRVTRMETNGTGSAGGVSFTATNDWMRTQVKDVRSWQGMSEPEKAALSVDGVSGYDFKDDIRKYLPGKLTGVTFANAADEDEVDVFWNIDDLSAGVHEYPASYGLGYYSSSKTPTYSLNVYKDIKSFEIDVTNKPKLADALSRGDHGYIIDVPVGEDFFKNYRPSKLVNLKFANTDIVENELRVSYNSVSTTQEKCHRLTLMSQLPTGYVSTNDCPTILVRIGNAHCFGSVLLEEGGVTGAGTWVRVDRVFNTIDFNPEHGTWKNIKLVSNEYGDFVEIPVTYVKTEVLTKGPYAGKTCWWISDTPADDFHVHPAFLGTDKKAHPLQVSAWFISKNENGLPCSVDKGNVNTDYWGNICYNDMATLVPSSLKSMGYRPYSIYDHHFIARMMLVEFNTPDVQSLVTEDGTKWQSAKRVSYHGIHDPYGIKPPTSTTANRTACLLYGCYVKDKHFYLLKNDGTDQMIDTNVLVSQTSGTYMKNCLMASGSGYKFEDVFIASDQTSDPQKGNFGDFQSLYNSSSNEYAFLNANESLTQRGMFHLEYSTSKSAYAQQCWRMSRAVTN